MISALVASVCALLSQGSQPPVTVDSLMAEMADLSVKTRVPQIPFKQLQASSYDRKQTNPKDPKTWFANDDWGGYVRKEERNGKTEWVMMEHDGPGAITRFWIPLLAERNNATIRFYFDGSDKPTIEQNYNDLLRGKSIFRAPFAFIAWPIPAPDSGVAGDLYYPIPFAKACKVTLSEEPYYFIINYRAYPKGTAVETFKLAFEESRSVRSFSTIATSLLQKPYMSRSLVRPRPYESQDELAGKREVTTPRIKPGKSFSLNLPAGQRQIQALQLYMSKDISPQVLRSTIVELTFDGNRTVWCPLGDFFGCGVRLRKVWDRFREVKESGMMQCTWPMPYKKSAKIRLINLSKENPFFRVEVLTVRRKWDSESMYFHATWRHQYPIATRPFSDWNYVEIKGKGVYVGDTLTVMNPQAIWYGEGDERVYVDGETFPSHLGTGTEDYYGYAWGMSSEWSSPFISMPKRDHEGRGDWSGFTTTSRVRLLDDIPFEKSLKLDMEVWHWGTCNVEYSAACFWYALPGATSNRAPSPEEAQKELPDPYVRIKGAIECESMSIVDKGKETIAEMQDAGLNEGSWSDGKQLFVRGDQVGSFVELKLPVDHSGKQHLILYATNSFDYGIVRISINGKVIKELDLWSDRAVSTGAIDLGLVDLQKGSATIRVEAIGANEKSRGDRYFFGLDCFVLR